MKKAGSLDNHKWLVEQMAKLSKLPMEQRMAIARKMRADQIQVYNQRQSYNERKSFSKSSKISFSAINVLFEAVARSDIKEVRNLIQSGRVDKDASNMYGMTALHQSCVDHNMGLIHILTREFGCDIAKADSEGWTPLHTVALLGYPDIARFLLDNGADPLALNADSNMPYDICDEVQTLEIIESRMASKGISQETIENLRSSGEKHMLKELKYQLSNGRFQGNCYSGSNGESLLHVAVAFGYQSVTEFLIKKANHPVSCFDNDLWQPIHCACYWQHVKVIEILLENGADVYTKTYEGENAIDLCKDEGLKGWLVERFNNNSNNSASAVMKIITRRPSLADSFSNTLFDSSVSLSKLMKLNSCPKRFNPEKKQKRKKQDLKNEYLTLISSLAQLEDLEGSPSSKPRTKGPNRNYSYSVGGGNQNNLNLESSKKNSLQVPVFNGEPRRKSSEKNGIKNSDRPSSTKSSKSGSISSSRKTSLDTTDNRIRDDISPKLSISMEQMNDSRKLSVQTSHYLATKTENFHKKERQKKSKCILS